MKNIKTIPFNWDKYQSDNSKYTVVTKSGDPITQLTKFDIEDQSSELYGVNTEIQEVYAWDENGKYLGRTRNNDLMLQYEEEVKDSWVNVYKNGVQGPSYVVGAICTTKEKCLKYKGKGYVTTINLNNIINELTNDK